VIYALLERKLALRGFPGAKTEFNDSQDLSPAGAQKDALQLIVGFLVSSNWPDK